MTPVNLQNGVRHVTAERSEDEIRTFESAGAQRRARQKYETDPKFTKLTRSGLKNKKYFHPLGERFNIRKLLQTIKVKLFYFSTA